MKRCLHYLDRFSKLITSVSWRFINALSFLPDVQGSKLAESINLQSEFTGFRLSDSWESCYLEIAVHLNPVKLSSDELTHWQKTLATYR